MLISSKGYGILWNNYGLTDFNPASQQVKLQKMEGTGAKEVVNVTSTEGGKQEVRERNIYQASVTIDQEGTIPSCSMSDRRWHAAITSLSTARPS